LVVLKPLAGIDLEEQEISYGLFVLSPIKALERSTTRVRISRCRSINHPLKLFNNRLECVTSRSPRTNRRHHSSPEFTDHPFGDFRILVSFIGVEAN
jgi:hypothetical protein